MPPVLPCVHLGHAVKGPPAAKKTDSHVPVHDIFKCAVHGRCAAVGTGTILPSKVKSCGDCKDYLSREPLTPSSAEMKARADKILADMPDYPRNRYRGRGVVIAGGGERYFPSLYVTVRALRHVGCNLPIQVWFFGDKNEMPNQWQNLLAPFHVEFVDADVVRKTHPARILNGWELKVFATLHSPFADVLFLDADCYPCRNPEFLFDETDYRRRGAIFWPDMATFDTRLKWPAFGVPDPRRPGSVESGQYVINKKITWRALNLAWFYNDNSDYYYRYCYGDKHTFEVAWTRCEQPFVMWQPQAQWAQVAYLHPGPDGQPLFVHRCADKFRFDTHDYVTNQNHRVPYFHAQLPLERECWQWMKELAGLVGRKLELPAEAER